MEVTLEDRRTGEARHRVVETIRKLPPVPHEWRLDGDLVLRHNGEPVLPLEEALVLLAQAEEARAEADVELDIVLAKLGFAGWREG